MVGVSIGMTVNDGLIDLVSGQVVADIIDGATVKIYPNASGSHTGTPLSFQGDIFKIALIRHACVGTYDANTVNYASLTANTDEVSGVGYTVGGLALSNVSPAVSGSTAFVTFGGSVTWTSANIDADGCLIYNTNNRLGGASGTNLTGAGRCCYVGDFGGRQTVANGTFTIVMPSGDATHAILRLQ
jgi:hypothetical protein